MVRARRVVNKLTGGGPDIAVLALIKMRGSQREKIALALSTHREVQNHTVYGVRWTARVTGEGGLDPYGVFAAVRARDPADLERWRQEIWDVLHPPKPTGKHESRLQLIAMYDDGDDETDELAVEEFYRDGNVEKMQHNGLP